MLSSFYRPHPKDGGGTVFTGVCPSTPGGGGVPQSQVLSKVTGPRSFAEGTLVPSFFQGHWSQEVVPQSWLGVPQYGVSHWPGQDGVTPPPVKSGCGTSQPGVGYPLPSWDRIAERALATRRYASCVHAGGLSCSYILFHLCLFLIRTWNWYATHKTISYIFPASSP